MIENNINIYTDSKFSPNIKCIMISLFLAVSYWYLPANNLVVLFFIIFITYIAIAWYDHLYKCKSRLYSGSSGISPQSIFKPKTYPDDADNLYKDQLYVKMKTIYIFHLFIVAPLMIYCGIKGSNLVKKISPELQKNIKFPDLFSILAGFGGLAATYHGSRLFGIYSD